MPGCTADAANPLVHCFYPKWIDIYQKRIPGVPGAAAALGGDRDVRRQHRSRFGGKVSSRLTCLTHYRCQVVGDEKSSFAPRRAAGATGRAAPEDELNYIRIIEFSNKIFQSFRCTKGERLVLVPVTWMRGLAVKEK